MNVLIDYQGCPVRMTDERWQHIMGHPEMIGMEDAIRETLAEPELVVRSRTDDQALLNYRYYLRTIVGSKWLCVVTKCSEEDVFVLTAYLTDRPKRGDVIWRKQ